MRAEFHHKLCLPMLAAMSLSLTPPAQAQENFRNLSLHDAIQLALENNLGAKVDKLQEQIEDYRVLQRKAEFDPALAFSGRYESNEKPQNTREFVATSNAENPRSNRIFVEDNWLFSSGIKGKLPTGAEYEFAIELNQLRNTLNIDRTSSLFYPEYESFAGLRLTQPLLRDFGFNAQLAGLRVAQVDRKLANLAWQLKVTKVVGTVAKAYYDLLFAAEDIHIKSENISRARRLEEENRKRVDKGVGSEIDVQQAAVAASVREEELIVAEYLQKEKTNLLLRDLVADIDPANLPRIHPTQKLQTSVPDLDRSVLLRKAIANRIEYQQARRQLEKQNIKIKFAKNQAWPRLDLFASLGANGLRSNAGDALNDAFSDNTMAWSAGFSVNIPLGNRQAKAQLNEALTEKEQLLLNFKQLEIDLALQVDMAASRVETSAKRLATARKSLETSNITLDAELKRLSEGVGVSFNVLEAQKDVASASTRELSARADLNKSLVDLWLATGTLLEQYKISLEGSATLAASASGK